MGTLGSGLVGFGEKVDNENNGKMRETMREAEDRATNIEENELNKRDI